MKTWVEGNGGKKGGGEAWRGGKGMLEEGRRGDDKFNGGHIMGGQDRGWRRMGMEGEKRWGGLTIGLGDCEEARVRG